MSASPHDSQTRLSSSKQQSRSAIFLSAKPKTYTKKFKASNSTSTRRIEKTPRANQTREILIEDDSSQAQIHRIRLFKRNQLNKSVDTMNGLQRPYQASKEFQAEELLTPACANNLVEDECFGTNSENLEEEDEHDNVP